MDLIKLGDDSVDELLQAQAHVWNHTFRFISSMSLKCAVQLEIPDIIHNHGQPMTISELALALLIHPTKVHCLSRLMCILVHSGFFVEHRICDQISLKEKGYELTLSSKLLLKDNPLSMRPFLLAILDPILLKPWEFVSVWFQSDDIVPFTIAHGEKLWDLAAKEPQVSHLMNECMASDGLLAASAVLSKCKGVFEGLKSLVDVGGGTGSITKVLARTFPDMEFVVFDLPHNVAGLQGSGNLKYIGGNMFEKVPPGDAIMLKWVLHDWSNEDCVEILKSCKDAIGSKDKGAGKVIILDIVMGNQEVDEQSTETKLYFDMEALVNLRGQQRSEQEWSKVFVDAGFKDYKIHHVLGLRSLIEVFP